MAYTNRKCGMVFGIALMMIAGICAAPTWKEDFECPNGDGSESCLCMEGYVFDADLFACMPHCHYECVNGYCTAPDVCTCHDGYSYSKSNTSLCKLSECFIKCSNGSAAQCSHRGHCVCPNEPESVATARLCHTPDSLRCTATNTTEICVCDDGYYKAWNLTCAPVHCAAGCVNGKCVGLGVCECDAGFVLSTLQPAVCVRADDCANDSCGCGPICCPTGCGHGICTGRNVCTCDAGYVANGTCLPESCEDTCPNGCLVAPGHCECTPGMEHCCNHTDACWPWCPEVCPAELRQGCDCDDGDYYDYDDDHEYDSGVLHCLMGCIERTSGAHQSCHCQPSIQRMNTFRCFSDCIAHQHENMKIVTVEDTEYPSGFLYTIGLITAAAAVVLLVYALIFQKMLQHLLVL